MADYWKSNERKHCDYCNCWIADNKPSVAFHEGGKKHKAAVAKKLFEIGKKSQKEEKERKKVDIQMRQMEDAAMKAYANDISRGGDITTQELNAMVAAKTAEVEASFAIPSTNRSAPGPSAIPSRAVDPLLPPNDVLEEEEMAKKEKMKRKSSGKKSSHGRIASRKEQSMWVEGKSDEGYTYYWNVKTGESIWEAPKEGYMTIEEYNRLNNLAEVKQIQELHHESKFMRENADELASKFRREQLKKRRVQSVDDAKEKEVERESYESHEEASTSTKPYGKWQTVVHKVEKPIDLQLPTSTYQKYVATVTAAPDVPVRTFKEKTITTLKDDEEVDASSGFKKRKFGGNRNVRQRLGDDD